MTSSPKPDTGHPDASIFDGAVAILESDATRFDDIVAESGLKPDRDFVGMNMTGADFVGTPERPLDLRGWNFTRCNLTGCRFEHVIVDETTVLDEVDLTDIVGASADEVAELAQGGAPTP